MRKFKKGDVVIYTPGGLEGYVITIVSQGIGSIILVSLSDKATNLTSSTFIKEETLELEHVFYSPLYQALK